MGYENIITKIGDDYVGEILLNRPKQWNAFNTAMASELDGRFHGKKAACMEGEVNSKSA
jgi:enoyl-CoA hydratase/carnithine racemase